MPSGLWVGLTVDVFHRLCKGRPTLRAQRFGALAVARSLYHTLSRHHCGKYQAELSHKYSSQQANSVGSMFIP